MKKQAVLVATLLALVLGVTALGSTAGAADDPDAPGATPLATQSNPLVLVLDARTAGRGLMYSHLTIPAKPGPFTIVYPKWIPGEHGPTGPLNDLTQIHVSAGGHALAWRRDEVNLYAFHVDVPQGADAVNVDFTVVLNAPGDVMSTRNIAIVNWNRDMLYQSNIDSREYYVKASLLLPHGWSYGTALSVAHEGGDRVDFETVPLEMQIDSPLDLGRFYKHVQLWTNGQTRQMLDMFADKPQDLDVPTKLMNAYKHMPNQAFAFYGSRHWNVYHSLLTLSDAIGFQGIEHHQSSDDRAPDDFMTNPAEQTSGGDLVTHELSHSWNGKYRRPFDLQQPNFQTAEHTELLWVYEGMNQYNGDLLSFRAGIREPKSYPEYLASIYAAMDAEPGRLTTSIIDTTTAAPYLYQARGEYSSLRRTVGDFYTEGELMWLDADTIIREQTGGKKSLDDFEHAYAGPPDTGPKVVTYTRDDVEQLLNGVAPYDWHGFFERYVYNVTVHPPTDELERSGWRLVYTDKPNDFDAANNGLNHAVDDWYSLGLRFSSAGAVNDVREGSAGWKAGLAPGVKILAIDGQQWDSDTLDYAIRQAQHSRAPIVLTGMHGGWLETYTLDYHGGEKYPHLVRIPGKTDMLGKIMAPH